MRIASQFLLSLCGVLLMQVEGVALQSAIRFSADGFFPEFADPASLPAISYPVEAFYTEADYGARLSQTGVGFQFTLSEAAPLEGLGVYDYGADGLLVDHLVGLWKLNWGNQTPSLVAATLVERGANTPFDGQWRYSTSLYSEVFPGSTALSDGTKLFLDSVRDKSPSLYWDTLRASVQSVQVTPATLIADLTLEPGSYAIISSQIASRTNLSDESFEDARGIDFWHFVEPLDRYPLYDPRVALELGAVPIGPAAYYASPGQTQYYEFLPTDAQLFPGMVVGPTLFLGVPEPTAFCLAALLLTGLAIRRK